MFSAETGVLPPFVLRHTGLVCSLPLCRFDQVMEVTIPEIGTIPQRPIVAIGMNQSRDESGLERLGILPT